MSIGSILGGPGGASLGGGRGSQVTVPMGWTLGATALCSVQVPVWPLAASLPRSSSHLHSLRLHLCINPAGP